MARFIKMPDELKEWNIKSLVFEKEGYNQYKISRKTADGVQNAILHHVYAYDENYSNEEASFLEDEARFLNVIAENNDYFTCINVFYSNKEAKKKFDLYIVTEDLPSFADVIARKDFSDRDIIEFGIDMADILSVMERKNIFHGNINPDNIFITKDGRYKLGGFSDFESKIGDLSFVAPEIAENKSPDMTTDIYSVGVIMYYLSNNKRLPFESDTVNKKAAVDKRNSGTSVQAPENGNEKLKSIIVIACQPKNKNRWKNAGNLKNALLAVQSELPKEVISEKAPAPAVIVAEKTDFEENVFDEYTYEGDSNTDSEPEAVVSPENESTDENSDEAPTEISEENTEIPVENESINDTEENTEPVFKQIYSDESAIGEDSSVTAADDIITKDVFDDFEVTEKSYEDYAKPAEEIASKDYGYFFDDDSPLKKTPVIQEKPVEISKSEDENASDNFAVDNYDEELSPSSKKRNIALIVISIIVILCALGFVGYCIVNNFLNNSDNNESTPDTVSSTASQSVETTASTTAPTTAPPETTQPTTVPTEKTVTAVVGYGYYYAKELLEEEGFTVEVGEYQYSTIYDEGYVISQSPEGDTQAEEGSLIVLNVSLGPQEPETTAPPETEPETAPVLKSNTFIFANSDSSYLSDSDVENLSQNELNIALNEIYARRGRIFSDAALADYFYSQEWYEPLYTADEFSENVTFNEYEQANVQLIVDVQKEKGYR